MKKPRSYHLSGQMGLSGIVLDSIHEREHLKGELLDRLLNLDHVRFERLILDLLRRSGYSNVQFADRIDKRGRTLQGGLDLKAYTETDISQSLTIAQVKQYDYPVPRRFVDELCNTAQRVGAGQALLITTSRFGNVARRVAAASRQVHVTLIDGDALVSLLIACQIGVIEQTVQRLVVDTEFFTILK